MNDVVEIGRALLPQNDYMYCQDYWKKETLKDIFPSSGEMPRFYHCPPISDYFKNCFGIYAVSDVNVVVENNSLHVLEGHKHSFPKDIHGNVCVMDLLEAGTNCLEYKIPEEVFVSDTENVFLEILPHPLSKYQNIISSKLNIYDWFRSTHISYYHDSVSEPFFLNIKKGEPIAMYRFITPNDTPVKLVELDFSKVSKYVNLREKINICNGNAETMNYKNWKKYFKIFSKKRPKNIIDYARIDK